MTETVRVYLDPKIDFPVSTSESKLSPFPLYYTNVIVIYGSHSLFPEVTLQDHPVNNSNHRQYQSIDPVFIFFLQICNCGEVYFINPTMNNEIGQL